MDKVDLSHTYQFWFGGQPCTEATAGERVRFWMEQSEETDKVIRRRFGHLIAAAAGQMWASEQLSRQEAIALVVLFDQFPRNIHRASAEAYAYDPLARDLARTMVADGWEAYETLEQFTLGLPFVHHEDLDDQNYILGLAEGRLVAASAESRPLWQPTVDQIRKHHDIIARFGRFPHRNDVLGRQSTVEERAFLSSSGRGF
ncbi:DUF924 family protein [Mesorhizobium sp. M0217]|uniref:DUF924 family protein n=1 Tax=unclassified Mesorhizobium TaxID=325217 RepID=UPI003338DA87